MLLQLILNKIQRHSFACVKQKNSIEQEMRKHFTCESFSIDTDLRCSQLLNHLLSTANVVVIFFVPPIDREQRVLNMSKILYHF